MLLQRRGALINVTGDATALSTAAPHISGFLSALPAEAGAPSDWRSSLARQNEALTVPTQVSTITGRPLSEAESTSLSDRISHGDCSVSRCSLAGMIAIYSEQICAYS